jgi:hypothetical protein
VQWKPGYWSFYTEVAYPLDRDGETGGAFDMMVPGYGLGRDTIESMLIVVVCQIELTGVPIEDATDQLETIPPEYIGGRRS